MKKIVLAILSIVLLISCDEKKQKTGQFQDENYDKI